MTDRERLTTDRRKIFARESLTIMSMNKDELRRHYNEIFDSLQEYEVAEEQGQLIRPPCKVGDKVYFVDKCDEDADEYRDISVGECVSFSILKEGLWMRCRYEDGLTLWHELYTEWGKTVFPSREEAEKALRQICKK